MAGKKKETAEELQVTSGAEWRRRREEGELVPLPSGRVARLRPVSLFGMAQRGLIPETLKPLVADFVLAGTPQGKRGQQLEALSDVLAVVCREAFMEPRIVDEPQEEDEIALEDVALFDQTFVFQWANSGAELLESFRAQQKAALELMDTGASDGAGP